MLNFARQALRAFQTRWVYPVAAVLAGSVLWPAQAQAQITVSIAQRESSVAPNVGRVSYSESYQANYVGWRVTLTGGKTTSTLQSLTVPLTNTADVTRPNVALQEIAALTALNASCTTTAASNTVTLTCVPVAGKTITVAAGSKTSIDLYYTSSNRLSASPTFGDCGLRTPTGCLTLNASANFKVGTSTTVSTAKAAASKTSLGTYSLVGSNKDGTGAIVTSSPKQSVRQFFTGTSKSASPADVFTTTVTVPPEAGSTSVSVVESLIPKSNTSCVHFVSYCYQSTVTVPPPNGVSFAPQYLTIEMRADPSNVIVPAGNTLAQVQNTVTLQYLPDGLTTWVNIGACPAANTPLLPTNTASGPVYVPCLNARFIDANGDLYWQFISYKNGGFKML